ncbi:MAG: tetratricopeptide repeat protein, partial [Planctomycetota bacterium]|nr:tetratricopeptide repeat protein [Planctomycetota bacterium]
MRSIARAMMICCCVCLPVFLSPAGRNDAALHADTVTLTSGKVIEDVATTDEGDTVRVTKADGSSMSYPRSMIKSIEKKPTTTDELASRRRKLPAGDVKARLELAAWCIEKGRAQDAAKLYEEALEIDPACEEAHKALGHILFNDRWYASEPALIDAETERAKDDLAALKSLVARCDEKKVPPPPTLLNAIISLSPEDTDARRRLGHMKIGGQWFTNVAAAVKEMKDRRQDWSEEAYFELGRACKAGRAWEDLQAVIETALAVMPGTRSRLEQLLTDTPLQIASDGRVTRVGPFRIVSLTASNAGSLKGKGGAFVARKVIRPGGKGTTFLVVELELEAIEFEKGPADFLLTGELLDGVKNPNEVIEVAIFNSDSARLRGKDGKAFGVSAVQTEDGDWDTNSRLMRAIYRKEPRTSASLAFAIP